MAWLYHGTNIDSGISIAERGAILSPLQQKIESYKEIFDKNPQNFLSRLGKDYIELAKRDIFSLFGEHDKIRVNCVSLCLNDSHLAKLYAKNFENCYGGLMLGLEVDDKTINVLKDNDPVKNGNEVIFVPKQISLEFLKRVYLTPKAKENDLDLVRNEFQRYNPEYILLE